MTTETPSNNIEKEYSELNSKSIWSAFYQNIRAKSLKLGGVCTEAVKPQNKILNRYRDVHPFDHSRIVLQRGPTDYINANLCKVEKANRKYILTQGPLAGTVGHFWLMVWEQNSKAILMLNKLIEKKAEKCYQYWPYQIGTVMELTDVGLTVEYLEQKDHSYYLTRTLRLTDTETNNSRDILQFHYITWPDFGVPCSPTRFLDFLKKVRNAGVLDENVGAPIIHCSAGIGRSGTFCLVDSCLVLVEKYGLNSFKVEDVLLELRKYRTGLIQTHEQLRFSYQAIIEGIKQLGNSSSDDDSEVKSNDIQAYIIEEALSSDDVATSEEDDEPPPLPPPRIDSLQASETNHNNCVADKPLPTIPQTVSDSDLTYKADNDNPVDADNYIPSGPLPVVPTDQDEDTSDESDISVSSEDDSEKADIDNNALDASEKQSLELGDDASKSNASELRHRNRVERKQQMEQKVRDIKRRQQANEQWQQLKRSLFIPLVVSSALLIGGGLFAYFYFK